MKFYSKVIQDELDYQILILVMNVKFFTDLLSEKKIEANTIHSK